MECESVFRASIASRAAGGGTTHESSIRTRPHQAQTGTTPPFS
ncbi:MAG TPA: hypothetical protein VNC40_01905 [Gaiellaceae bacterium]|nr:hypothetical protein [Gaiellaceae bacterium]